MNVVYPRCGGIDVHKRMIAACRVWQDEQGRQHVQEAGFGTYTADLRRMAE